MKTPYTYIFFLTLSLLCISCAGPAHEMAVRSSTEEYLLQAGFKPLPATKKQDLGLEGFPTGQITSIQRHGVLYYIYPDLQQNRFLIGGQEEYARYHLLVARQIKPLMQPNNQLDRDWVSSGVWKN